MIINESSDERCVLRRNKILENEMVLKGFVGFEFFKKVYMNENLMNL